MIASAGSYWITLPLPAPRVIGTTQITSDAWPKSWPLLTDGSHLFYNSGNTQRLPRQVSVKGGDSTLLPMPFKNANLDDISPDGTQMLLCRFVEPSELCELWAASVKGGQPRRLGHLVSDDDGAAWSPNGEQLVYTLRRELHLARNDGKEVRTLAELAGNTYSPRWSPDGSTVRFSVLAGNIWSIWEARIDGSGAYPLLPGWNPGSSPRCGNWTPNGKYYVFQATNNGVDCLWALREKEGLFHRAQRGPFQLTHGPLGAIWPVSSTDGKRIFAGGPPTHAEFFRYDLKSGQLVSEFRGISGTEMEFSRDGNWIVYVSQPDRAVWRSAIDGSRRQQLTQPPFHAHVPHWSPDGAQIVFAGGREGNASRIYVISRDGGDLKRVTNGESGNAGDWDPSWSSDGASIVFGGSGWDAPVPLRVIDTSTGRISVLPNSEGMWSPRWSPGGRFIAGISQTTIVLYDCRTQKQSELSHVHSGWPSWSRDGKSLFYLSYQEGSSWWRVWMHDRRTERIGSLKDLRVSEWFAPAPNDSIITNNADADEIYA